MLKEPHRLCLAASRADVAGTWRKVWATKITASVTLRSRSQVLLCPASPSHPLLQAATSDKQGRSHGQWDSIQPAQLFPALSAGFPYLWLFYALCHFIQLWKSKWKKYPHFPELRNPTCICRGGVPIQPIAPVLWVATSCLASWSLDLPATMMLQKWEFFRPSWKGWQNSLHIRCPLASSSGVVCVVVWRERKAAWECGKHGSACPLSPLEGATVASSAALPCSGCDVRSGLVCTQADYLLRLLRF